MSLINILKKKIKADLFTTPSHSQQFSIFPKFKQFYKYDISENEAYNPQAALISVQKKASEVYGTKSTYFLTNGSTSGIIASVLACVGDLDCSAGLLSHQSEQSRVGSLTHHHELQKVLIWDKAHPCHANAVKLAGATPVFYELEKDEHWGIYTETSSKVIEEKLAKEKINAVIITSPTYEGIVSDIVKIKEICKKYGAYLIVDEAHGALYPFCDKLPTSAIYQGTDFVIQSLHKTAGGLNPTALLHCNVETCPPPQPSPSRGEGVSLLTSCKDQSKIFEKGKDSRILPPPLRGRVGVGGIIDVQSALDLISTASPSYPLLASIEKNINYLNSQKGRAKILELIKNIEDMKKNLPNLEFYQGNDLTKILIKHPRLNGYEFSDLLFNKYKIEDEKANEKSTMLLCGIGTDLKKLKRLEKVLRKI